MKSLVKHGKVLALIGLTFAGSAALAQPAQAYDRGHDRDWHAHEVHARAWHRGYPAPAGVVYAPPAVVYAPPEPSPGINLVLPLNFR